MYDRYLFVFFCEKCKTQNAFDTGDPQDMTGYDADAISCYKCGHIRVLNDEWKHNNDELLTDDGEPLSSFIRE